MIFSIQFALIFAGYGAVSNLSGQYMELYTRANNLELGLYFMLPNILNLARPLVSAQADRNQSHQRMLTICLFGSAIAYLPYVLLPYLLTVPALASLLTYKLRFWLLFVFHLIGSLYFNSVRGLADATAQNYAKRVDIEYVSLRKWAPVGFGLCGYLFGLINQDWIMPDFVPSFVLFCACMFTLGLLVHLWPREYFQMTTEAPPRSSPLAPRGRPGDSEARRLSGIPSTQETLSHLKQEIRRMSAALVGDAELAKALAKRSSDGDQAGGGGGLTVGQQLSIFGLILRRDFRISLAILLMLVGGWTSRSAQNFVFVEMERSCQQQQQATPGGETQPAPCNSSTLAGEIIAGFSILEFVTYVALNFFRRRQVNRMLLLELAMISLALHYYFYAFLIDKMSPHWYLIESLHGFEFAIYISTCLGWGYMFASQVEFIIPELLREGVISQRGTNLQLVKVSLVATMMSTMTLVYDGIGSTIGALLYGWLIEHHSFQLAWIVNGTLTAATFFVALVALLAAKCFNIRPAILELREQSRGGGKAAQNGSCCDRC